MGGVFFSNILYDEEAIVVDRVVVPPMDAYNQSLVENAHPGDWVNPVAQGRYNLVVIGAGRRADRGAGR
jgi:hypothetical protein